MIICIIVVVVVMDRIVEFIEGGIDSNGWLIECLNKRFCRWFLGFEFG